jgi:hypothetical protein
MCGLVAKRALLVTVFKMRKVKVLGCLKLSLFPDTA